MNQDLYKKSETLFLHSNIFNTYAKFQVWVVNNKIYPLSKNKSKKYLFPEHFTLSGNSLSIFTYFIPLGRLHSLLKIL